MKKRIVILTGAGISAESGIPTFRGSGGLWNGFKVEDVATPQGWAKNKESVLEFYNQRRKDAAKAEPNDGHLALVKLEQAFNVSIITQNVDDLHERAGSSNILHLHGMLKEVRSSVDDSLIYDIGDKAIELGDKCAKGSQLRPNVVWFGEDVPNIPIAIQISKLADYFIVIGTSLQVYPAASLMHYVDDTCKLFLIDPFTERISDPESNLLVIKEKATVGVTTLVEQLLNDNV